MGMPCKCRSAACMCMSFSVENSLSFLSCLVSGFLDSYALKSPSSTMAWVSLYFEMISLSISRDSVVPVLLFLHGMYQLTITILFVFTFNSTALSWHLHLAVVLGCHLYVGCCTE